DTNSCSDKPAHYAGVRVRVAPAREDLIDSLDVGVPAQHVVESVAESDSNKPGTRIRGRQFTIFSIFKPRDDFLRFMAWGAERCVCLFESTRTITRIEQQVPNGDDVGCVRGQTARIRVREARIVSGRLCSFFH